MPRREHLVVTAIWLLGLAALGSVLVLQGRLSQRRQAQLAVASLRLQVSALPKMALGLGGALSQTRIQAELNTAERQITATAATLDGLAGNHSDASLIMTEARALFPLLARANALASKGQRPLATLTLGLELLPGHAGYQLNQTFAAISAKYDQEANSAREFAEIGSILAIVLLLTAFTGVLWRASRLAREKHALLEQSQHDALTDQLTGLANRRRLFVDLERLQERSANTTYVLGILDLDGFKAYNDQFGHPAGDELLALIGSSLRSAVDGLGRAYRMGGDEFCLIAHGPDAAQTLESARVAVVEQTGKLGVGCSLGSAPIPPSGASADDVLHAADVRLYHFKRTSRPTSARDRSEPDTPRAVVV